MELPRLLSILIILLWSSHLHTFAITLSRGIDPALQKQIDDFITQVYFPQSQISKFGLAIVQNNGEILYNTGFGMSDEEKSIPNTNQTQFLVASITKSFTSLVVVKTLHELFPEMGEAVLDTPIRKLIPSYNFTLIDRFRSEHATFRDLLSHRLCLFRDDISFLADAISDPLEISYRQRYNEEICGVRTQLQYNNQMYVMAGEVLGKLANKTFVELTHSLLNDIGMTNSTLGNASDDNANMPYRAKPYYVMNGVSHPMNLELPKRILSNGAAAGLYTTPNDMAKYMMFHLNKGNANGRQIIPEEVMAWTKKPSIFAPQTYFKQNEDDFVGSTHGYGLGLFLGTLDGWEFILHDGYTSPYSSSMSLFPSQNLGIFTTTNEGPVVLGEVVVHAFIFQLLQGKSQEEATSYAIKLLEQDQLSRKSKKAKVLKDLDKLLKENVGKPRKQNNEIVGEYGSGSAGDAVIFEKFNNQTNTTQLYVQYGKWLHGWLEHLDGALYLITWDTDYVQELYSLGDPIGNGYLIVEDNEMKFAMIYGDIEVIQGVFKLGVSLDKLPPIPWNPDSC